MLYVMQCNYPRADEVLGRMVAYKDAAAPNIWAVRELYPSGFCLCAFLGGGAPALILGAATRQDLNRAMIAMSDAIVVVTRGADFDVHLMVDDDARAILDETLKPKAAA
jgi:hypothetical protein